MDRIFKILLPFSFLFFNGCALSMLNDQQGGLENCDNIFDAMYLESINSSSPEDGIFRS